MKLAISILIISFLLDGIVSNIVSLNSFFLPLCSLMALIIIFPYFKNNLGKYLKYCFVLGFFYDVVYLDTFLVNFLIFGLVGLFLYLLNQFITNNALNVILMGLITIVLYRFISYLFYILITSSSFVFYDFIESIYLSLLFNTIYIFIVYIITDKISQKFKIIKID